MAEETENDTSNFAKMFDKLPAFNPPDNNSAGAIALRAWVRGLTARGPPALAFLRKYEEDNFAGNYDSFLPSGTGSQAKKSHTICVHVFHRLRPFQCFFAAPFVYLHQIR